MTESTNDQELTPELEQETKSDPLEHVRGSTLRSLSDVYHLHAELLDEQRGVLNDLRSQLAQVEQQSQTLTDQGRHLEEVVRQAEERIQTGQAPIDTKPTRRFGHEKGPGF